MRYYLTIAFLFFSVLVLRGQNFSKPTTIEEAVLLLDKVLEDSTKQKVLTMTEDEFISNSHFGLGMWIRNNWGLWRGGKLAKDFNRKGIFHPDDMSGIILTCYYRHIHEQDWKLDEQIAFYQEYWNQFKRLETDTAYARQAQINIQNLQRARNEELKLEFPIGMLVKTYIPYSWFGSSQIIGEIIDWRINVSKGECEKGIMPEGYKVPCEFLEVRLQVVEYSDITKKKKIERYLRKNNNELWEKVDWLKKIE
jgi:hypothetical protein